MTNAKGWLIPIFCLCVAVVLPEASAKAESYVAGQFGSSVHGTLNDPDNMSPDLGLKNSLMYGAKLGHYFDNLKYFGVETEAYTLTPDIKQGAHLRVTTWAVNAVYRYPGEVFQPYAGVGLGMYFAHASDAALSGSSISPGLNVQAGLRVLVTKQVALFGEYKFNSTEMHFKNTDESEQYKASLVVFGVGYHF